MLDIILHAAIAFLAFVTALFVEHYRTTILSRLLFWKRREDLMGTYATSWTIEELAPAVNPGGSAASQPPMEDLVRIKWASGSYISGTASNARFGDYTFQGRVAGDAITLSYSSSEEKLKAHLGVIMLRIASDGTLSGYWVQNKPGQAVFGTTKWTKR